MAQDAAAFVKRQVAGVEEGLAVGQAALAAVGVAGEEHVDAEVGGGGEPAWVVGEHEAEAIPAGGLCV